MSWQSRNQGRKYDVLFVCVQYVSGAQIASGGNCTLFHRFAVSLLLSRLRIIALFVFVLRLQCYTVNSVFVMCNSKIKLFVQNIFYNNNVHRLLSTKQNPKLEFDATCNYDP